MKGYRHIFTGALLVCLLALYGCSKYEDEPKETSEGRNTLSFTACGFRYFQYETGGFIYPLHRWAKYSYYEEDGRFEIVADVTSRYDSTPHPIFSDISIVLASENVYSGSILQPIDIALSYLYLPRINGPEEWQDSPNGNGGYWTHAEVRHEEYREANISEAMVQIRKWSPEERILAGNFTIKGNYADSTGKVHNIEINDGLFDLTDTYYK